MSRLSCSSALALKATGYPLAFIAAKFGLGIPLNEIKNSVTKVTSACFEPSLDHVVVKIPRWDLKKLNWVSRLLCSNMKSAGEAMATQKTFGGSFQKAVRLTNGSFSGSAGNDYVEDIDEKLVDPTDRRVPTINTAFHQEYSVDKIWQMTDIDKRFLNRLYGIFKVEQVLTSSNHSTELVVRQLCREANIHPFVKQIDTVAAEFPSFTNYLHPTYNAAEHDTTFEDHGIMVLGSGVYRIGSSVEFDRCAVRAIRTLRDQALPTVMVNHNPETVSTDYDEVDRLMPECRRPRHVEPAP
ncbi:hypothetical protein EST38_g12740 [Candolleomyces aberdarensis]|uniref:Carbamoyl-phosphate synthetase large subunit oligomerisation domain-containing protein n=1 Tax=Candolleomyces aberdarensis TaxID=2316362 RepID=A0A4Q2D458_9AGAR|nr:hypothetical protein EST38_g12740 [Candolleomyces aberdarensis]